MGRFQWACVRGHVAVLEWWKQSGLPLKYDYHAWASAQDDVAILEWWKKSGLCDPMSSDVNVPYLS